MNLIATTVEQVQVLSTVLGSPKVMMMHPSELINTALCPKSIISVQSLVTLAIKNVEMILVLHSNYSAYLGHTQIALG